jgi:UDP-glucose 4-epimerase
MADAISSSSAHNAVDVLVTGGSGRLGRYVVQHLAQRHPVTNADRAAVPDEANRRVDILDRAALDEACRGVDVVVHLAALDYDTHAAADQFICVNTLGTWNVLQASVAARISRVVVCSSVAALGLHENRPEWTPTTLPVDEHHPLQPNEPYGLSKLIVEEMTRAVARAHDVNIVCVRPAAIVFPEEVDVFLSTVDPSAVGLFDYVTATDVAAAIELAVDGAWAGHHVVTVVADDSAHPDPTLEWYPRLAGPLPTTVDQARFAHSPRASVYSNAAATDLLGWRPTSDFNDIRASAADGGSTHEPLAT